MFGLSDEEISALLHGEFEKFLAPEQALLRMADALADTPADVSDELYSELRRHFTEEQLIEFAADAGQENSRARANRLFNVGSDSLYCELPKR
jgi:alkylhydroperoxidase family enzyme